MGGKNEKIISLVLAISIMMSLIGCGNNASVGKNTAEAVQEKTSSDVGIIVLTLIPFTGIGREIGLHSLNGTFFIFLGGVVILYMALVQVMKNYYVKREGELL